MSSDQTPRDLINSKWFLQDDIGHKGTLPTAPCAFIYAKAIIEIASADGALDEDGLNWVIGFAGNIGTAQAMIDQLKSYKPGECEYVKHLFNDLDQEFSQVTRPSLLYHAFRAASANGIVSSNKRAAIQAFGKKLNMADEQIEQCRALADEEDHRGKKREKIMFPDGFQHFITILNKQLT